MSCETCEDIAEKDGVEPDCATGRGCKVPAPGRAGVRAIRLRASLLSIGGLVGPETVLRMHNAARREVELLQVIEDELEDMEEDSAQ